MTVFVLEVKVTMDGVESVSPRDGNQWNIGVRNPLNDYERRDQVLIRADDLIEVENSKSEPVNLGLKWEGASKMATLKILDKSDKALKGKRGKSGHTPRAIVESDSWTPVLAIDCRGLEPDSWKPGQNEFIIKSTGGSVFDEDVFLGEEDGFGDYCEAAAIPVSVSDLQYRFLSI